MKDKTKSDKSETVKTKKCKICKKSFVQTFSTLQVTCTTISCVLAYSKAMKSRDSRLKIQEMREKLKTRQDHLKELQVVFNTFVRHRDKAKPCISCEKPLSAKFDAGHYYSVGSYPNLRFDESNVHGQCVECNQHRHGNLLEYAERLPGRIGQEAYEVLQSKKNGRLSLTALEIKELIVVYKQKVKLTQL
jgi:gamma-glutamylcyclotransferase (GGCT)/AIG2-like uncharacterized protein YtfP